ncbi:hypothetical protein D3C78_1898190 [compost metagenome]
MEAILGALNEKVETRASAAVGGNQANTRVSIHLQIFIDIDLSGQLGAEQDDPYLGSIHEGF